MAEIYFARTDVSYSGGDKFFTITFSYIKKEHIKVFINDEETENFTFNTESQIVVNDDLVVGDIVSIRRTTPIDERMVVFSDTSILNKDAQNLAQEQLLNAVQEVYDNNIQFNLDTLDLIGDNKSEIEAEFAAFTDDINSTIEQVREAAQKLDALDAAVAEATSQAELATQQAEESAEETNTKLAEMDLKLSSAQQAVNDATEQAELAADKVDEAEAVIAAVTPTLDNKADTDGSNILASFSTNIANILTNSAKETFGSLALPSSKHTSFTVGATGATYTMPADGWLSLYGTTTGSAADLHLFNNTTNVSAYSFTTSGAGQVLKNFVPVNKGDTIQIYYTRVSSFNLRLVYLNGNESEA